MRDIRCLKNCLFSQNTLESLIIVLTRRCYFEENPLNTRLLEENTSIEGANFFEKYQEMLKVKLKSVGKYEFSLQIIVN